jgi:hypothetical protein
MYTEEVADLLNMELADFQKIEESIAGVFLLKKDRSGRYEYAEEHVNALRDVFMDGGEHEEEGFLSVSTELDDFGTSEVSSLPLAEPEEVDTAASAPGRPDRISIMPRAEKPGVEMNWVCEREPLVQKPDFQRISKTEALQGGLYSDMDLAQKSDREEFSGNGNSRDREESAVNSVQRLLNEQREYFEQKLEEQQKAEAELLKEENISMRKKILTLEKEAKTMKMIIRSQDRDRLYLVEKLNEKYSLWNLFTWRRNREEFSGERHIPQGEI